MSADDWRICPWCSKNAAQAEKERQEEVRKAYGKVPAEEYLELVAYVPSVLPDTLREDWELGMNIHGEFNVTYKCSCSECGFSFKFVHTEQAEL